MPSWINRIVRLAMALLVLVTLVPVASANPSAAAFFKLAWDSGVHLPADRIYPRGREFPFSFFSVGGVSGGIKPNIQKALEQVKRNGCTMIGPQYELNDRILKDAKSIGLKAIYTLTALDTDGKLIGHHLGSKNVDQAVKSVREQVRRVVVYPARRASLVV